MNRGKTIVVVGAQWGSEGKGQVAAVLAEHENCSHAVRTGSINAGHTVYYKGKPFVMQIVPTAWVLPNVRLVLGAGCYIEPDILDREVQFINQATGEDVRNRLVIDSRCSWFGAEELRRAKEANRHHAMGATGKGASEGIISKMKDRGADQPEMRQFRTRQSSQGYRFADTQMLLNDALERGENVLVEGTQGAMLDFHLGPYPFVTTRQTNSAAWLAECGLPPVNVRTVLVVRSHPIRVAGNSGPMPGETSWLELARELNAKQEALGLEPVAPDWALVEFERVLEATLRENFAEVLLDVSIAPEDRIRFHRWTPRQRVEHRVAVSEANAVALRSLTPACRDALVFFEKTTVTKKLRRIANLDLPQLRYAIAMNAPDYLVYTFLNYDFPHLRDAMFETTLSEPQVQGHLDRVEQELGVPIHYATTGALPEHQIRRTSSLNLNT